MMSLTFGLFTQVSGLGPLGPLVFRLKTCLGTYTNSADPVQVLQNAASDQGQHCLLTGITMQNNKMDKITRNP